jgi:hypothetical protein
VVWTRHLSGTRFGFLYLSVRDFLEQPHVWSEITSWTKKLDFDVNLACACSQLLRVKTTAHYHGWGPHIRCLLDEAIGHVAKAELSTGSAHTELVDEIDKFGIEILPSDRRHEWVGDDRGRHARFCVQSCSCLNISFLDYAIMHGLTKYVNVKWWECPDTLQKRGAGLLDIATGLSLSLTDESTRSWSQKVSSSAADMEESRQGIISGRLERGGPRSAQVDQRPILPMIKLFLVNGVSPNEKRPGSTHWVDLVSHMESIKAAREALPAVWISVCTLYIVFNADLDAVPSQSNKSPQSNTVESRLRALFQDLPSGSELFREMSRWRLRHQKRPISQSDKPPLADRITQANSRETDRDWERPRKRRRGRGQPRH